jgi:hypothetical protein
MKHRVAGKAHVKKAKGGRKRHRKAGHKKVSIKA